LVWLVDSPHDQVELSFASVHLEELGCLIVEGSEEQDRLENSDADRDREEHPPVIIANEALAVANAVVFALEVVVSFDAIREGNAQQICDQDP
jgi:hypothetical protein